MFNKKEWSKDYYEKNKIKLSENSKQWRKNNPEKCREYCKRWKENNTEKVKKYSKEYYGKNFTKINKQNNKWYENNPEKVKKRRKEYRKKNIGKIREYENRKYEINSKYNLSRKISNMINKSIRGNKNNCHWEKLVDYNISNLIKKLKSTIPKEYLWNDFLQGRLHIDHIIPTRAFIFDKPEDEEFKQCWSLYNLRLLPAKENRKKHDKITNPILLGLLTNQAPARLSQVFDRTLPPFSRT